MENMLIDKLLEAIKPYKLEIKSILDLGTRDLEQSIEFHSVYPKAKIYAIEANKESYKECLKIKPDYIDLFCFAALDYNGTTTFYNVKQTDNKGASSVFEPTERVVGVDLFNGLEKTTVICKRIETWAIENKIESIDLLWQDIQGCEVPALKGFGKLLDKVKVIATEAQTGTLYHGNRKYEPTQYDELKLYLGKKGFIEIAKDQPWPLEVDLVFIRRELCK
jgi:FkbM family methyltransferase